MAIRFVLEKPKVFNRIKLGEKPLICVPMVSYDTETINNFKKIRNKIDLIEIRIDHFFNDSLDLNFFEIIKSINIPYIFTFRAHWESDKRD